ncbi:hypothetical protein OG875_23930 [Streptomyces sp. NBC_01498]|nr:hypothetical protein [Streptomyces sp. NBC_01498]WTL27349.1 hypothetical protein OG875_23930 [Streptomyces sp. NBC_01498]
MTPTPAPNPAHPDHHRRDGDRPHLTPAELDQLTAVLATIATLAWGTPS